jgi:hypothetical protein
MNEEFNRGVTWLGAVLSLFLIFVTALVLMERSAGINSPVESPSLLARSSLVFGPLSILVVHLPVVDAYHVGTASVKSLKTPS